MSTAQHLFATGDVRGALEALETRAGASAADGPPTPADWTGEEYMLRGWALLALRDPDAALDAFWEAGARASAAGHTAMRVEMLNGYAQCLVAGDPLAPARGLCAEATVRSRKLRQPGLLALTLRTRGIVAFERCRFDDAEASWTEGLSLAHDARDRREESAIAERLATFYRAIGRARAAADHAERAVAAADHAGDRRARALAQWTFASCLAALGDADRARAMRAQAEDVLDALRLPRPRVSAPSAWNRLYVEARNHAAAGRRESAMHQAAAGARALTMHPPLLDEHDVPSEVIALRAQAAILFQRLADSSVLDPHALRAADEVALPPVDDKSAAVQLARRARVEAQHRLARAERRVLAMGLEIPAGACASAAAAVEAAWMAERQAGAGA